MSRVTNVMLSLGDNHKDNAEPLKKWCEENTMWMNNDTIDTVSGGSKHMEVDVYCWGANHMDREGFMEAVSKCPWNMPDSVQIMLKDQDDICWNVYNLTPDKKWIDHVNQSQ